MATPNQNSYIADLVVLKTKEFKEVKEMLLASGIIGENAETVQNALTIAEITNVLTDLQASQFIDLLIATPNPKRDVAYSQKRVDAAITALDDIQEEIRNWDFNTL
jgi:hypothetical protein